MSVDHSFSPADGSCRTYLVRNIRLGFQRDCMEACAQAERLVLQKIPAAQVVESQITKRSIDARKKPLIFFVYTVSVTLTGNHLPISDRDIGSPDISLLVRTPLVFSVGTEQMVHPPVIVGFGPAGMFAALTLAEHGYRPVIVERGGDVEDRVRSVRSFYETKQLDPDCNIQFGAGGAGTFSDGKLVTRINDPKCRYVLEQFVRFGADPEIMLQAKPHIGTDVLTKIIASIRDYLLSLGAVFQFRTTLIDIPQIGREATVCVTNQGEIAAGAVVLAPGHSARDTAEMLQRRMFHLEAKPFSVGVRIEHLQTDIDQSLYGAAAGDRRLPHGEYSLSYRQGQRGVYSFCMCPGGEVVAAASEADGVVVNGMSRHLRNGKNANSAIAVSILPEDFGGTVSGAIAFQRHLEQAAFAAGGGSFRAPFSTVGDFLSHHSGAAPTSVQPTYMNGFVTPCDLHSILPGYVSAMLETGLKRFDGNLRGFAAPTAVLTGVETRTSSPLRILRDDRFLCEGREDIYPCGEGAGYAGGITSAAVDGINSAAKLMERFAPPKENGSSI